MRARLASAAALAALIALATAVWLGRSAREETTPERRVEQDAMEVPPAADLAGSGDLAQNERVAAPVPEIAPVGEEAPAGDDATTKLIVDVVSEEYGTPLPGVPLMYLPWPPEPLPEDFSLTLPTTDEHGRATLRLPPGGTQVYAMTQEDRKLIVELAPGETRSETLRLRSRPDLDVYLLIVDAQSGAPLAGAEVEPECFPEEHTVGPLGAAVADASGRVALSLPSWITYHARVSARGYTTIKVLLRGVYAGPEHARRVALQRTARLEGAVTDGSGARQVGVAVSANAHEEGDGFINADEHLGESFCSSDTDHEGKYALEDLPAGVDLSFAVRTAEQLVLEEQTPMRLGPGEVRVHNFVVDVEGSIRGIVLDAAGAPVARQRLWLARGPEARQLNWFEDPVAKTTTDDEGRFLLPGIPRGTWLLAPEPLEHGPIGYPMSIGQVVELPEGVSAVDVELRLPLALSVSGRCVDEEGGPVAGVNVAAVAIGTFAAASAVSAEDGTFAVTPLPAGELVLMVGHDTLTLDSHELPRVHAGDTDILLRMVRAARVRGTVLDSASGLRLSAEVSVAAGEQSRVGGTSPDGTFEFQGLPPGRCVLVARTSPNLVSPPRAVDLSPDEEAWVELQVAPGAQVHVLLPEDQGQVSAHVLVGGDLVLWLGSGPGFTGLIPPGPFTVELRSMFGVLATKEGSAAAGETVEIDLR